jgi:hypothetical protein
MVPRWPLLVLAACGRTGFELDDGGGDGQAPDVAARYAAMVMADAPIGYWRFDDDAPPVAADASGHDRDGVYKSVTFVPGVLTGNPAVELAGGGSGSAIELGDHFNFAGTAPFSVELWANPGTDDGLLLGRIDYDDTATSRYKGWFLNFSSTHVGIRRAGLNLDVQTPLPIGTWTHVVATYDGFTLVMYVDGERRGQRLNEELVPVITSQFQIGRMSPSNWKPFNGRLDEVAIYDRALTEAQVSAHYQIVTGR